jgi:pyruvate formate lyase activating enzyme
MKFAITDIQRNCFHDGPGVRTTIFLKGCPLNCPWCANPESKSIYPQIYYKAQRCLNSTAKVCNKCLTILGVVDPSELAGSVPNDELASKIVTCCSVGAIGVCGKYMDIDEIMSVLNKDKAFFKEGSGGVTISGGEPLMNDITELLSSIKSHNYNIAIETSLYVSSIILNKVSPYVDLFIVDIKILDTVKSNHIINGDIGQYQRNIRLLSNLMTNDKILYRVPVVKPYIYNNDNIRLIKEFIHLNGIHYLELLPVHNIAKMKYQYLNVEYTDIELISDEDLLKLKCDLETTCGIQVSILR